MDLAQYIIPATAGLLSGVIGSLVAPWVQWGIDARREKLKARRELISKARDLLANPPPVSEFRKLPIYFQLKPHLDPATVEAVTGSFDERGKEIIQLVIGGGYAGVNPYAHLVQDDLSKKEKKWKLI